MIFLGNTWDLSETYPENVLNKTALVLNVAGYVHNMAVFVPPINKFMSCQTSLLCIEVELVGGRVCQRGCPV